MQRGASLGDILLEKGYVKQAQLDDAKRWQKTHPNEKISAILLSRGIITEDAMLSEMAERFVSDPTEVVSIHQHVMVKVIGIDAERKRIRLSMAGVPQE